MDALPYDDHHILKLCNFPERDLSPRSDPKLVQITFKISFAKETSLNKPT